MIGLNKESLLTLGNDSSPILILSNCGRSTNYEINMNYLKSKDFAFHQMNHC